MRVLHSADDRINTFYDVCTALENTLFEYFIPTYKSLFNKNPVSGVTNEELMQICNVKAKGLSCYLMANPPDYNEDISSPEFKTTLTKDWDEDVEREADWCLGDGSYMVRVTGL